MSKTFVGFGFGPITSGLNLFEAYQSGNFSRFVIDEVDRKMVEAVRANGGRYTVNVARKKGIEQFVLEGIELYSPQVPEERQKLVEAIAESDEMATALPSVKFFDMGEETSVAKLIADGIASRDAAKPTVIYASENNNHAAELLEEAIGKYLDADNMKNVQALNTVVGKMSGVISDQETVEQMGLVPAVPGFERAILVEEFNRILVTKIKFPEFKRGIDVYLEKEDLLPFEEAKLYGHNAIHAMIAYLSDLKGLNAISDAAEYPEIMTPARKAFLEESGGALCRRHAKVNDELFTPAGYQDFADDLLERMVNPYLNDLVERVGRDQLRKLSFEDRLYGTMNIALDNGIEPVTLALGAAAGVVSLIRRLGGTDAVAHLPVPDSTDSLTAENMKALLCAMWDKDDERTTKLAELTWTAFETLKQDGWL